MIHHDMLPFRTLAAGLALLAVGVSGYTQEYCSSENTGGSDTFESDIYNSNLACSNHCQGAYAFAVVQYQSCWCSNYAPADQASLSSCSQSCPGWQPDHCGDQAADLYGYIALSIDPSGTAGVGAGAGATSSSTTTTLEVSTSSSEPVSSSSGPEPPRTTSTLISPQPSTSSSSATFSSISPSPSSASVLTSSSPQSSTVEPSSTSTTSFSQVPTSSSSSPSSTSSSIATTSSTTAPPIIVPVLTTSSSSSISSRSPVTSVEVVTQSGAVVTQTVTSTPTPISAGGDSDGADPQPTIQHHGLSGGAIAGVVIGVLVGLAALALAAFLLWRRKSRPDTEDGAGTATGKAPPKRNISVLSKSGLLAHARPPSMAEREDEAPYVNTNTGNSSVRHSMIFGGVAAAEGVSPSSVLGSTGDVSNGSRRNSKPLVYDQRLNPSALFANAEANGSRVSMQDQQDYSRPLGIANPDLRASLDSRYSHG